MPRLRLRTDDEILDAAIALFWRRGFAATSMRDLTQATGLGAAALYHRFGDKNGLFLAALRRYAERGLSLRLTRLGRMRGGRRAIAAFFDELIATAKSDCERRGCLLVNTALDGGTTTPEARALVRERLGEIEKFFRERLEAAQREGTLALEVRPKVAAEELLAAVLAIRVLARFDPEPRKLRRVARRALAIFEQSPMEYSA